MLIYLAVIGSLIGMPLIVASRQVRLERRRIMADRIQSPGQSTAIKARTNGQAIVNFTFDPTGTGKPVTGRPVTSMAVVRYESASQCSRDYSRMFGAPPQHDLRIMQLNHIMS